jgi:hypothetical protein
MPRTPDALAQFTALRSALVQEREVIQARLRELDAVLGEPEPRGRNTQPPPAPVQVRRGRPPKGSGAITKRDVIEKALASGPLRVSELVPAMQRLGYQSSSNNPSLRVKAYLYSKDGKKRFKSEGGKFSCV